jgi:hypothetical protein
VSLDFLAQLPLPLSSQHATSWVPMWSDVEFSSNLWRSNKSIEAIESTINEMNDNFIMEKFKAYNKKKLKLKEIED